MREKSHSLFLFLTARRSNMLLLGARIVDHFIRDAGYSLRVLRRTPVFATVATLSLALGIGANAAIFQLIDTVRFRSLPVADPQTLAEVHADGVNGFGISSGFNSEVTSPLWAQ